jgi:hypothetical protein
MNTFFTIVKELGKDALSASLELFKVMIPILVAVKILQEMGLIQYLALPLEPVMKLVGLPAEMGIVWASALINNIYTGMIVLASLVGDTPLTSAQATVLGVLLLVGHALPVECAIARKSGARFLFQVVSRLIGAFILAWLLHMIYSATGTLQGSATMLFTPENGGDPTIMAWVISQIKNMASIVLIIFTLMSIMRILQAIRVIDLMNRLLRPVLSLIGIGPKASAITVIGLTMGLSYGGGLIINEAKNGNVGKEDIFYSLTLMGLCHSLIEDSLLIMLIGGHISGVLWGRLVFSLIAMAGIVQLVRRLPKRTQASYLWIDN